MEVLERLNQALKLAGHKIGYSKKSEVCSFLGYKFPYYSGIINGKEKLSEEFLKRISDKLNISKEWVLTGEGYAFQEADEVPITAQEAFNYSSGEPVPFRVYQDLLDRYESVVRENEQLRLRLAELEGNGKKKVVNS